MENAKALGNGMAKDFLVVFLLLLGLMRLVLLSALLHYERHRLRTEVILAGAVTKVLD